MAADVSYNGSKMASGVTLKHKGIWLKFRHQKNMVKLHKNVTNFMLTCIVGVIKRPRTG